MTEYPDAYWSKVLPFQCNDLTTSSGCDTASLSHPRFIEFRDYKDTTGTLERAFYKKAMAMELK